jgi:hypothetical protein
MKNINDRNMARLAAFNQPKHRLLKRGNILLLPVIAMMERLLSIDIDKAMRDMMVLLASGCNHTGEEMEARTDQKGHPRASSRQPLLRHQRQQLLVDFAEHIAPFGVPRMAFSIRQMRLFKRKLRQQLCKRRSGFRAICARRAAPSAGPTSPPVR